MSFLRCVFFIMCCGFVIGSCASCLLTITSGAEPKARFPNSRPCRYNRLCRFKFLEATGTIIWKRSSDHPGRSRDDPCDRNNQSSEIDSSSILATETTGKDSQAIAYF